MNVTLVFSNQCLSYFTCFCFYCLWFAKLYSALIFFISEINKLLPSMFTLVLYYIFIPISITNVRPIHAKSHFNAKQQ